MRPLHRDVPHYWRIGTWCVCLLASTANADEGWDPPTVLAKPDHEQVARNPSLLPRLVEQGRQLFVAKFTEADGAGRPGATGDSKPTPRNVTNGLDFIRTAGPDAMACSSCHNHPTVGGSGDAVTNVFVGAHFSDPPTTLIDRTVTNERNTISLAGSGLIELLAREMTLHLWGQRDAALAEAARRGTDVEALLSAKGVSFGQLVARPNGTINAARLEGIDYDLVIRPFGSKGVAASLREFSIAALNQHHGVQAIERFGWERTGVRDFDSDGVEAEFSIGQVTALVVFQAQIPAPKIKLSSDPRTRDEENRGKSLFTSIGCSTCHIPSLSLDSMVFSEPSVFNRPGAIVPRDVESRVKIDLTSQNSGIRKVAAYTDLKRHTLCDDEIRHFCNELRKQDNIPTELFLTAKLWDASSSAPYGHRGDLRTLSKAILSHGGEARTVRDTFVRLSDPDKRALVLFLRTLGRADIGTSQ